MNIETFKQWWRPLGAVIFIILIALRYSGLMDPGLNMTLELAILELMKWFIGLYVAGRTIEGSAKVVAPLADAIRKQRKPQNENDKF